MPFYGTETKFSLQQRPYWSTGHSEKFLSATWSSAPASRHSSAGVFVAVLTAFLMFVLGLLVGAFLHAIAFPDGGSPLVGLKLHCGVALDS
ncbi:unnamed protein product [Strongylus vulgaris]|uniref:Uncharacterized protein n=1 Tax=Strongylus vulgaris TaxID=40348 RepID=A0A3P7IVJ3_STRVU|nr:unnamed protein product [Strongylus vulgaris]